MYEESILIPFNFIQILLYIILFETALVGFLLVFILFYRVWSRYQDRKKKRERHQIAKDIMDYMKGNLSIKELHKYSKGTLLIKELEIFNQRFAGEEWEAVRNSIAREYLLPRARKDVSSKNWAKRLFAARAFSLNPLIDDESYISVLMNDPVFLVRSNVVSAGIQLEKKELIYDLLKTMSHEQGYANYFYRDVLLSSKSAQVFQWIEEIASNADDTLQLVCLDILSGKMIPIKNSFLLNDLKSPNSNIQLAALKVFGRNPQKNSLQVLLSFIDDPNDEMRTEAFRGLEHFRSHETLKVLEKGLSDPSWLVSAQAAESLMNMGQLGRLVLERQNLNINKKAFESASYILQLDW